MLLDEARCGAREGARNLKGLRSHDDGMGRAVDPKSNGLAVHRIEAKDGQGLVRGPVLIEAEPQIAAGEGFAAIDVDVGSARAGAEAGRLQLDRKSTRLN